MSEPTKKPTDTAAAVGLWATVKSVLAAFFGVQSNANYERDAAGGRPALFLATAAVLTLLLVILLVMAVRGFIAANSASSSSQPDSAQPSAVVANRPSSFARDGQPATAEPLIAAHDAAEKSGIERRVAPCLACHQDADINTASGYIPRIAGKPAGYLYNQLLHFRAGRRQHKTMTDMVSLLSNGYLWEMANYFAARQADYPEPETLQNSELFARGEQLALTGDATAEPSIPACSQCHGSNLVGVLPTVPGLLGLPSNYTMAQFSAWQTGSRRAAEPDCMQHIAEQLSIADQQAVAYWLASRPLPKNLKPLPGKLASDCGSLPLPTEAK